MQVKHHSNDMTTVSVNRQLNNVSSASQPSEHHHFEIKSIVMPHRNGNNGTNHHQQQQQQSSNNHTSSNHRQQPTSPPCSSDSDITMNTTSSSTPTSSSSSSATAMRRLYFKTAKLNKTTPNSITTLHQQQPQYVPKVNEIIRPPENRNKYAKQFHFLFRCEKGYGNGIIGSIDSRNNNQYIN